MIVHLKSGLRLDGREPPTLYLSPETDYERRALAALIDRYEVAGFGKTAWGDVLHVSLELQPKEKP